VRSRRGGRTSLPEHSKIRKVHHFPATPPLLSRRRLLIAAAGVASACAPAKAVGYRGYCLVANRASRNIGVVDLLRFRLRRQIPLDAEPSEIVAHPSATKAFVLTPDTGTVQEIDAERLAVSRRVRVGNRALNMSLAPGGKALWVLLRDPAELVELPLDSFAPRRRVRLPWAPNGFTIGANLAAVASYANRAIAVVSLDRAAAERVIDAKDEPSILHFRRDGAQLIAGSHPDRALTIFDPASGKTVVRLPVGIAPRNFCPDNTGGQLYVTGDGMDAVVVIYPYETEIGQTILAGHAPGAMAVTLGDSPLLLVANPENDRITALDANNTGKSLVTVVDVGQEPHRIVITPDNEYALALNRRSGDLSVIRRISLSNGRPFRRPTPLFTMIPVGEEPVAAAVVPWSA
jgi:DNA-binding beta-propeller fold protein YncE